MLMRGEDEGRGSRDGRELMIPIFQKLECHLMR